MLEESLVLLLLLSGVFGILALIADSAPTPRRRSRLARIRVQARSKR